MKLGKIFKTSGRKFIFLLPVLLMMFLGVSAYADSESTADEPKFIYLSFDDGPCEYTGRILDILDKYNAKATFFVVPCEDGQWQDMLCEISARGHCIGIHCYDHEYERLYADETAYIKDFSRAQEILYGRTGTYATVCRFPGGSDTAEKILERNERGSFERVKEQLSHMGVNYYDWNVKIEGTGRTGNDIYYAFTMQVPLQQTPICLQHDTRLCSVNTLERMLQWGIEAGYSFAAIDEHTPPVQFR